MTMLASSAVAAPDAAILQRLMGNYDPKIEVESGETGRSLVGCPYTEHALKGKDPVTGSSREVRLAEYAVKAGDEDHARAILIIPPTGGENLIDQGWANFFCARGFRAVIVRDWDHQDEATLDPAMHDTGAVRALASVRHAVEFLESSGSKRIGILGASVGAMTSGLAIGLEPRIKAAALVVGGVGMHQIIARSTEETLTQLRQKRMEAYGYATIGEYEKALAAKIRIDPADFAGRPGRGPVLAVVATEDETVPTEFQDRLVAAYRAAPVIRLQVDHSTAIRHAYWYHCDAFKAFFENAL